MIREDIRNIAIIAHVDHGKTTLVDQMLKQGGVYRENQQMVDRVMDSNDIERERGITILAKNTAVHYMGHKINIVDTPGHADFGGEVERVLKMVDGVLLLVDSFEGPMPQTRFVLKKALELKLKVLIVINKIDRPDARCEEVVSEILDLLIDLEADETTLDNPILYVSARKGTATMDLEKPGEDLRPLFDAILKYIPAPEGDPEGPAQVLISTIDYSEYVGRIGVGRITRGKFYAGMNVVHTNVETGVTSPMWRLSELYQYDGLKRVSAEEVSMGDIVALCGMSDISIGDTVCAPDCVEGLPFVKISEPTVTMTFQVNDSPFAGREGEYVTSRHLRARLMKELQTDVSLRVNETDSTDAFEVCGRGELHLSILIENMRRQGYEFAVSKPRVIYKVIDGVKCEPVERLVVDTPQATAGAVIEKIGRRRGVLEHMSGYDRVRLEFLVPSRGLFGYRSEFMTDTRGEGIMSSVFEKYEPVKGDIPHRNAGALVAHETGTSNSYGLFYAQERGTLFIGAGIEVYEGMIVGQNARPGDLVVNVCKQKHVTNMRNASASEDSLRLVSVHPLSLEECLEFIDDDELLEITPKNLRMRKRILSAGDRSRQWRTQSN
ncbi:MAG: translational GTPase TypA [Clostridia bacterium]|nr:translational GTPase TypA [Clostridia bacterium]MBR0216126.1 translational GTPase TypA [Clostridia bacterium]